MKKPWICLSLSLLLGFLVCCPAGQAYPALSVPEEETAAAGYIALTFDDGPSGKITQRLLDGLEARQAKATFFLCGYRLEQYPQTARQIAEKGHELGLHGYSHRSMGQMDPKELRQELEKNQALLMEVTGQSATLLRPPGGCCSSTVHAVAKEQGLTIITWSLDPRDWAVHDASNLTQQVVSTAADGDVVLLHDMWNESVEAALAIIDQLQPQGYVFVTVSELAAIRQQELVAGETCSGFRP